MGEFSSIKKEGPLTIITIERAEVMNSLHPPGNRELAEAFDDFASDPDQWVAIITGAGDRAFSAGNDLKYQASGGDMSGQPASGFAGLSSRFDNPKPVIAAVNGVAMGGGFEIALACDLIIASENAVFALPEPRVGLAALAGGIHRLPREIGMKQAMGMLLTGRRVSAEEGKQLGFVNDVVPEGQALEGAKAWAAQILECAPLSVRGSKQAAMAGMDAESLEAAIKGKYDQIAAMRGSDDFVEGPLAFAEKRAPNWKGK
ncbi:MAG: enoyl-CoA hydratase/isomerase family protein [Pseudomonadales bacterium]|jgi:enoyl-CoA hydratase/carnithine racemase|nr:enoyl-CoA hydratase/isomerase family protein [Pseudomonadales bacterium]